MEKRGSKIVTHIGRSPTLNESHQWHGRQERGRRMFTYRLWWGKGPRTEDGILLLLHQTFPGYTFPPSGHVPSTLGGEDTRQSFSGPLFIAPLGLLMEKKSRSGRGLGMVSLLLHRAHF